MSNEFIEKVSRVNTDIDTVIEALQELKKKLDQQEKCGVQPFISPLVVEEMNIDRGQYRNVIKISVRGGLPIDYLVSKR